MNNQDHRTAADEARSDLRLFGWLIVTIVIVYLALVAWWLVRHL
jgi:hypothetical protein